MSDDVSEKNWTIKAMPIAQRKLALACATKRGEAMPEWMVRAIETQAAIEAGDQVLPPPSSRPTAPAVRFPGEGISLSIQDLRDAAEAAKMMAEASGVPVPKTHAKHVFALLNCQYRAARGLAPILPRISAPKPPEKKTIEGKAE